MSLLETRNTKEANVAGYRVYIFPPLSTEEARLPFPLTSICDVITQDYSTKNTCQLLWKWRGANSALNLTPG